MSEHTKDKLAAVLREVGLHEMAERAATGYYHDFLSPLDLPELTLIDHLGAAARASPATEKGDPRAADARDRWRFRCLD